MRLSEYLTDEGVEITGADSRWMKVTEEECRRLTDRFADEFSGDLPRRRIPSGRAGKLSAEPHQGSLFPDSLDDGASGAVRKDEGDLFRKAVRPPWDAVFPPVRIELQEGRSIYIEGMIDRVDILSPEPEFPLPAEGELPIFQRCRTVIISGLSIINPEAINSI